MCRVCHFKEKENHKNKEYVDRRPEKEKARVKHIQTILNKQ
jgi:hypothetical protein